MKGIKTLLFAILIATYTSSWWAVGVFGKEEVLLWIIPCVSTVMIVVYISFWMADNWNDKK